MIRVFTSAILAATLLSPRVTADVVIVTRAGGTIHSAEGRMIDAPSLSADGRFIAFTTDASNIVAGQIDPAGKQDVFLYDRESDSAILVSHAYDNPFTAGNADSNSPQVSADGNYVVFSSVARDLIPSLTGSGMPHLYLYDRRAATVRLITHGVGSTSAAATFGGAIAFSNAISADGRYVVYWSRANDLVAGMQKSNSVNDVFVYDRLSDSSTLVSHAPSSALVAAEGESSGAVISSDGSTIAFSSRATTLMNGLDDTNGLTDLFLYDVAKGLTTNLVSRSASSPLQAANGRASGPFLSRNGNVIAYDSTATNVVEGQVDANGESDLFVFDRATGRSALITHRLDAPATTVGRQSSRPMVSSNGETIVFNSSAPELHGGPMRDFHVYRYDRSSGMITLITHAYGSTAASNGYSVSFSISDDGRRVAINSGASNLAASQQDTNGLGDSFVCDADAGCYIASTIPGSTTRTGNGHTLSTYISGDGRVNVFTSYADNLADIDSNSQPDLFLWFKERGRRRALAH
jgi:Tol biopolymer transport system component